MQQPEIRPDANLRYANLSGANLRHANLGYADLGGANLGYANLGYANLGDTCLDPMRVPNGYVSDFVHVGTRNGSGWCIGWRTKRSPELGGPGYEVGQVYTAEVFSVSDTSCHPGLYLEPRLRDVASKYRGPYIMVLARPYDIHTALSKYRCREFVVVAEAATEAEASKLQIPQ